MRLALVATGGLHPSGTDEIIPALMALVARLARVHDVHAFTLRHLPEPVSYPLVGATIHDLGRPRGRWSQWRALARAIEEHGPFDVMHGFWVDPGGVLAAIAGRRLAVPSVVTCDSGEFTALPALDYGLERTVRGRSIVSLACRLATRVHVTTSFMEELARARGYAPVKIPIGIDLSDVAPDRPPEGPPWRLLQVASLNAVKDQTLLLEAMVALRPALDVRLDLVGEDTLNGRLQREAAMLGLGDAVTFHGFVPHHALAPLYSAAHLYVQSSRHEAAGVSVLEAAACELPIVGTRVGHVSDWAPARAAAVAPGDAVALAEAIGRLIQRPDERHALAAAARAFVSAHDVGWTAGALTDLYTALVGTAAGGRGSRLGDERQA